MSKLKQEVEGTPYFQADTHYRNEEAHTHISIRSKYK